MSLTSSLLLWERGLQLNLGIDKLHMSVIKDALPVILPVLTELINRSLLTSVFPSAWKESVVLHVSIQATGRTVWSSKGPKINGLAALPREVSVKANMSKMTSDP